MNRKSKKREIEKLDSFYEGISKVKDKVDTKMEDSIVHFEEYDWEKKKDK